MMYPLCAKVVATLLAAANPGSWHKLAQFGQGLIGFAVTGRSTGVASRIEAVWSARRIHHRKGGIILIAGPCISVVTRTGPTISAARCGLVALHLHLKFTGRHRVHGLAGHGPRRITGGAFGAAGSVLHAADRGNVAGLLETVLRFGPGDEVV